MDDELKAKLLTYLNEVEAAATTGKDFLIEQAPLYVQELLAWGFWENTLAAGGCVVAMIVCGLVALSGYRRRTTIFSSEDIGDITHGILAIAAAVLIPVTIIGASTQGKQAVKVVVAPRVVIVEKLHEALQ